MTDAHAEATPVEEEVDAGVDESADGAEERRAKRLLAPAGVYLASRLVALLAVHVADVLAADLTFAEILGKWDSGWYLSIVTGGYPDAVSPGEPSSIAFFPLFPLIIRGVAQSTGLSPLAAGVVVSLLGGMAGVIAVYLFAEEVAGQICAQKAAALWSFFPGAFVFSMVYTEGLFVAAAAVSLLALLRQQWVLAGLAAAAASGTRPNGLVLAACCAYVALPAAWRGRCLRPLVSVALAPAGAIAYALYLEVHTGSAMNWLRANDGFGQQADWGASVWSGLRAFAQAPTGDFNILIAVPGVALFLFGTVLMIRQRSSGVAILYVLGLMVPVLLKTGFGATSRYLMVAFPVVVALALAVPRQAAYSSLLGVFAGTMTVLMVAQGASLALTP